MNDSDDELISSIAVDDEEEEDWNDTGWAQPPSNTGKVALSINFRKMVDTGEKGPGGRVWLPQQDNQDENTVPVKHHRELEDLGIKAEVSHHDHLKALKESIAGSVKDNAVVDRMSLNDNKAGMDGLDKARINQIIHEASKGSKFYENERKKEEQMKKRIEEQKVKIEKISDKQLQQGMMETPEEEEQKVKIEKISDKQLQQGMIEADELLEEFERYRDLSHTIVHLDMDAFYAAVEMRDNPSLKNKPMAVGGSDMLSTSNYHARKFGVRAAMPGFIGKKLCPNLIIVPTNFDKYTAVSKEVKSILREYDQNFCPMSLDEAYLDITEHLEKRQFMGDSERTYLCRDREFVDSKDHCLCDLNSEVNKLKLLDPIALRLDKTCLSFGQSESNKGKLECSTESVGAGHSECERTEVEVMVESETREDTLVCEGCGRKFPPFSKVIFGLDDESAVQELRARIEQRTRLTASAGIAPNMMLAKVCSDKNKPNGQYRIPATREAVLDFIKNLPTRKISGIGKVSEMMLNAVGVSLCTDLYEKRALLHHLYSPISFNYFMRICLGIGSTTVERDSERKSISTERTFSEISKPADLYKKCEELCEALVDDLKEEKLKGKTVSIKLKTVKFEVKTRAHSLADYTADKDEILSSAIDLLKTEIQVVSPQPLRLRLMGVRMSNLLHENLCKNKRQNTITGLLKKMSEKVMQNSSPHKNNGPQCEKGCDIVPTAVFDRSSTKNSPSNESTQVSATKEYSSLSTAKQSFSLPDPKTIDTYLKESIIEQDNTICLIKTKDTSNILQYIKKDSDSCSKDTDSEMISTSARKSLSPSSILVDEQSNDPQSNIIDLDVNVGTVDTVNEENIMGSSLSKTDAANLLVETSKTDSSKPLGETSIADSTNLLEETSKTDSAKPLEETSKTDSAIVLEETSKTDTANLLEETSNGIAESFSEEFKEIEPTREGIENKNEACMSDLKGFDVKLVEREVKSSESELDTFIVSPNKVPVIKQLTKKDSVINESFEISEIGELKIYTPRRRTRNTTKGSPLNTELKQKKTSRKQTSAKKLTAYVCPICCQNMLFKDLNQFNEHIDDCMVERDETDDHFPAPDTAKKNNDVHITNNHIQGLQDTSDKVSDNSFDIIEQAEVEKVKVSNKRIKLQKDSRNKAELNDLEDVLDTCNENALDDCDSIKELGRDVDYTSKLMSKKQDLETSEVNNIDKSFQASVLKEQDDSNKLNILGLNENNHDNINCSENMYQSSLVTEENREKQNALPIHRSGAPDNDLNLGSFTIVRGKSESVENVMSDIKEKLTGKENSAARSVNEIKPNDPKNLKDSHALVDYNFHSETQCDIVSSSNEPAEVIDIFQIEPELPNLSLDLFEMDLITKDRKQTDNECFVDSTNESVDKFEDDKATREENLRVKSTLNRITTVEVTESEKDWTNIKDSAQTPFECNSLLHSNAVSALSFYTSVNTVPNLLNENNDKTEIPFKAVTVIEEHGETSSTITDDGSLLVCPICNIEQRVTDLGAFNNHVDSCLSRGTISEILKKQSSTEKPSLKRTLPSFSATSSQKSTKRRKTDSKLSSCRSIASFFQKSELPEEK